VWGKSTVIESSPKSKKRRLARANRMKKMRNNNRKMKRKNNSH
jgi:hypothetical protein